MRRREARPLAGALEALTRELAPATPLAAVQAAWPEAAGEAIAREAEPVAEREGTVTIACRSSVWAHEVELLGPELARRLNARLGQDAVRRVRAVATGLRR
jgi:predicted nucleic acid-binding Zn ribbon protein